MGRTHDTEEQIAFALRQAESGRQAAEIIRKPGVSEQTFDRWKKQYAVPEPSALVLMAIGAGIAAVPARHRGHFRA